MRAFIKRSVAVALLSILFMHSSATSSYAQETGPYSSCPVIEDEIVDLEMLASALRETRSLGPMSKLRLKSDINKMLRRIDAWHSGKNKYTVKQLQEQYDLLLMKIAALLQEKDFTLHQKLCNAWASIWVDLLDPERVRQLRGK